jgi:aromatic ring-opening dioxygenase catalytic subunit (LigB family)
MGAFVWAAATSHTGAMMRAPKGDPESLSRAALVFAGFAELAASLKAARPDAIVTVATDHFLTFDYANLPIFAVGTGDEFPSHGEFGVPKRDYRGVAGLGEAVHRELVSSGFDAGSAREMPLDHSFSCPLQLLMPDNDIPVLPIYVNCTVEPLPSLSRCAAFGVALGDAIRAQSVAERVAIIGTGGLSHWVGVPQTGQINTGWDRQFLDLFVAGKFDEIASWRSEYVSENSGNGAAEIRNWLIAANAVRAPGARELTYQPVQTWVTGIALTELIA